jgi:hypothetical protein
VWREQYTNTGIKECRDIHNRHTDTETYTTDTQIPEFSAKA